MECDVLIRNGNIIDGSGRPSYPGHIALKHDRIHSIIQKDEDLDEISARKEVDATGLFIAPGFIDVHSHNDFILFLDHHPQMTTCLLEQGITTVIGGNCGFSPSSYGPNAIAKNHMAGAGEFMSGEPMDFKWGTMASYLNDVEEQGTAVNLAMLEGHGTMRFALTGTNYSNTTETDQASMERFVEESMDAGAFGLSFGLGYEPGMFTSLEEIERLASVVKKRDGIMAVHLKALSKISPAYGVSLFGPPHNITALNEMVDIANKTGVKLQISHLIFVGTKSWPSCEQTLEIIQKAYDGGLDIAFDSYPQMAGNTTVYALFPEWFLKDPDRNFNNPLSRLRLALEWKVGFHLVGFGVTDGQLMWGVNPEFEKYSGRFITEIAQDMGCSPIEAYVRLSRETQGKATCLFHKYSGDENEHKALDSVLTHPLNMFMTDAIISTKGAANPGAYGTYPRVIDYCCKSLNALRLEDAINKMTGRCAERFGIKDRGIIDEGMKADITMFDLETIRDNTTLYETRAKPSGIKHVFLNGVHVVDSGTADSRLKAGSIIRSG